MTMVARTALVLAMLITSRALDMNKRKFMHQKGSNFIADQAPNSTTIKLLPVPEPPADIRAIGVKLFSEEGFAKILQNTMLVDNVKSKYVGSMPMLCSKDDHAFKSQWRPDDFITIEYGLDRSFGNEHGVFIDVGAAYGDITVLAHKLHPNAKLYAYEISPLNWFYMKWNLKMHNIPEIPCEGSPSSGGVCAYDQPTGFSPDGKPITFAYVQNNPRCSGVVEKRPSKKEMCAQSECIDGDDSCEIMTSQTESFESLLKKNPEMHDVEFLKLDCEGCEWFVAPAMIQDGSLDKCKIVTTELHCFEAQKPKSTRALGDMKKTYDVLKARSGKFCKDFCQGGNGVRDHETGELHFADDLQWFDLDKEVAAKKL